MLLHSPSQLLYPPKRIVSLVPSQTELLFDLGLENQVVGITKFCVHPAKWKKTKTIVGGTKNINPEIIRALAPNLIIANKEENIKEQVEALAQDFDIFVTDVANLGDAMAMINNIGQLTHATEKADEIAKIIRKRFTSIKPTNNIPTAYLIWRNPYMTIGGDTFISDMLTHCGLTNIYASQKRYPAVDIEDLKQKKCRLLLLPSEPYPFKQKHIEELQHCLPHTRIMLVDGEMFSWYGSRLLQAPAYFNRLIKAIHNNDV